MPTASRPTLWPPAITPGSSPAPTVRPPWPLVWTTPRINPTHCSASSGAFSTGCCLPVGGYRKPEIREIAQRLGLRVADKKESQDICFVPDGDHAAFIRRRVGESATAGAIVTTDGREVGQHDGLERFTIGQRKGLGIALGEPRFVVRLEPDTGRVVIGSKEELARGELTAAGTNWLATPPTGPLHCDVKIRYNSRRVTATIEPLPERPAALPIRQSAVRRGSWPGGRLLLRRASVGWGLDRITSGRPD